MAIIKTYPLKSNYFGSDKFLISDMQPDSEGNVSGDTKNITFSSIKSLIGGGAAALQLTTTGTSGAATFDVNTNILNVPVYTGDTYTLQAEAKSGTSVPLKLDASTGTDSTVSLTEGANVTLTRNSANEIEISATGGNAGVSSITNAFGTYITGTANSAATGAVGLGTIDLNAANGTSDSSTRFLSKDNTWDVPSYTAPAGSNTEFQYNNNGSFGATSLMVFTGNDEIQIGQQTTEQGKLIVSGQAAGTSGLIKIEGKSARGVTFSVQPETNVNYDVIFPETGPGGNNKILESDTSGNLAWISTPVPGPITASTGITNYIPKYSSSNALANSVIYESSSNIGIGTTTPAEKLEVAGNIKTTGQIQVTTASGYGIIEIGGPSGGFIDLKGPSTDDYDLRIISGGSGGSFWTGGFGHVMTLNSSGNVGIGTTSPTTKLDVSGTINLTNLTVSAAQGTNGQVLTSTGSGVGWQTPTDNNSTYSLGTGASAGQIILTGSNPTTSQTVTVAGTNGISITQFTSGTFNVNLDLATSSARGGVKIGFAESGKNYPVELSSEKMFVNVPWTDTVYTLPEATATVRGGIELFSNTTQATAANSVTTTASRTYGIQLNAANQAVVNVPWVGGGTGSPAGIANNVQFSDGTSFSADVNFNWDASAEKLILGKDSNPQFQEGILRLLGDGQGGTAGTIEFQSAQGKAGGAAATLKLQGPTAGVTQEILLPDALPTANTQILGIDTIVGTKVTTQWETPSTGTTYTAGAGITINSGNQISNTDKGSSQFIYKNFTASSGGSAVANSNNDTLTIAAGSGITTTTSGDTITVAATGSGSYDDGFIPLDIYEATSDIGGNDGDFSYIRQTQSYNSSTVNTISFFVSSIGSSPEIRFALFDGAKVKTGAGTCRVNAASSSLTAGVVNEMALTDGEGSTLAYTCVPGKEIVLFFALKNCTLAGSPALSNSGLGHQTESFVSLPVVDDPFSNTKTAVGSDPNNKIVACHFFKT